MGLSKEVGLVTVYVANSQPEAQIIKGRLESEGIPAMLRYESVGLVYGLTVDGLGQIEVQVPSSLSRNAQQLLTSEEKKSTKPASRAQNRALRSQSSDLEPSQTSEASEHCEN